MGKRYYWLKLNESFFESEEIKIIENMKNGQEYIIFYLKLLLKSIKTDGRLLFRNLIPYTPEMLSSITNTSIDTVKVSIDIFAKLGLLEIWDDGTLFMVETQNMIGSESDSAKRVRKHRELKELQKKENKALLCNDAVTNCNTEIDIELEIDIDKDKDIDKVPYTEIQQAFNDICTSFPKVIKLTKARKNKLKNRWKELKSLDKFIEIFTKMEQSDFMKGKNKNNWKATFDWVMDNDTNYVKVLEGNYDNRGGLHATGQNSEVDVIDFSRFRAPGFK